MAIRSFIFVLLLAATTLQAQPIEWPVTEGGNGHYYEMVADPNGSSWDTAYQLALDMSYVGMPGHLVTITSLEENTFCYQSFGEYGGWAGGYQPFGSIEPAGSWRWITEEPWIFDAFWGAEPNDCCTLAPDEENFLRVWFSGGGWNDSDGSGCSGNCNFVVEYEPGVVENREVTFGVLKDSYK